MIGAGNFRKATGAFLQGLHALERSQACHDSAEANRCETLRCVQWCLLRWLSSRKHLVISQKIVHGPLPRHTQLVHIDYISRTRTGAGVSKAVNTPCDAIK